MAFDVPPCTRKSLRFVPILFHRLGLLTLDMFMQALNLWQLVALLIHAGVIRSTAMPAPNSATRQRSP